jgi:hypothetical protein
VQFGSKFRFATYTGGVSSVISGGAALRASHDTRDQTVARLRRGYLSGRLGTDTFDRRIDRALQAESHEQLHGLTVDLPAAPAPSPLARLWSLWRPARRGLLAPAARLAAGRIVLGRSSGCQLVLSDDTVSRRHAELRLVDGRWYLRDLGSSNGTWLNGRRVVEVEVVPGDEVQLGACRLRL